MNIECPVCKKEYSEEVTRCERCGFSNEPSINRDFINPKDRERWENEVVKPYCDKFLYPLDIYLNKIEESEKI